MQGLLKQPRQAQGQAQLPGRAPQPAPGDPAMQGAAADPLGQDPAMQDPMLEDDGADENNPAFQAAVQFAKNALYEEGAADNIHNVIVKSQSPVDEIANIAYEMTSIADEKTGGEIPDELLVMLASTMLEEVADIAEASGVPLQPADIAAALKNMILRFVGEQGYDTRQLQEAMDQVSPDQINQMAMDDVQQGAAQPAALQQTPAQQPPQPEVM